MAATDGEVNLVETLKPFYQRASEAEERLSRLEASLANKKGFGNEELLKKIEELELRLEGKNAELTAAQEKVEKLVVENMKLQYRIVHLVRAIKESDAKLESVSGVAEANTHTSTKLEHLRL